MNQEFYNNCMKLPGETVVLEKKWKSCPKCRENYCGDGVCLCEYCGQDKIDASASDMSCANEAKSERVEVVDG